MDAHNTLTSVKKHELELDEATCMLTTCISIIKGKEVIFQTNCNSVHMRHSNQLLAECEVISKRRVRVCVCEESEITLLIVYYEIDECYYVLTRVCDSCVM